jgi:hypothetical protein
MIIETGTLPPPTTGTIFHDGSLYREGLLHRFWSFSRQLSCSLLGHRHDLKLGSATLALRCERCGWTSPGWDVGHER